MYDTVDERVAHGARVLDRLQPGWHDRVEPGTLVMSSNFSCVFGQLFDDVESMAGVTFHPHYSGFSKVLEVLHAYTDVETADDALVRCGFITYRSGKDSYDDLWRAWLSEIARRRVAAAVLSS